MVKPGTSSSGRSGSDITMAFQPVLTAGAPGTGQVAKREGTAFPEQVVQFPLVLGIGNHLLKYDPVVPDGGEMPARISDIAVRGPVVQGGPGLDARVPDIFGKKFPVQVREQGQKIQGPVTGWIVPE